MNTITIELCQQDRDRLDAIIYALHDLSAKETPKTATVTEMAKAEEITPTETETKAEPAKQAQSITPEQLKGKVIQLCAADGGKLKATVRGIVNEYAKTVSEIPADKLTEVWTRLTALEG